MGEAPSGLTGFPTTYLRLHAADASGQRHVTVPDWQADTASPGSDSVTARSRHTLIRFRAGSGGQGTQHPRLGRSGRRCTPTRGGKTLRRDRVSRRRPSWIKTNCLAQSPHDVANAERDGDARHPTS